MKNTKLLRKQKKFKENSENFKLNLEKCLFSLLNIPSRDRLYVFDLLIDSLVSEDFRFSKITELLNFSSKGIDDRLINLIADEEVLKSCGLDSVRKIQLVCGDSEFPADLCLKEVIKVSVANNLILMSNSFQKMLEQANSFRQMLKRVSKVSLTESDMEFLNACTEIAVEINKQIKEKNFDVNDAFFQKAVKLLQVYEAFQSNARINIADILKEIKMFDCWDKFWKLINQRTFEQFGYFGTPDVITNNQEKELEKKPPEDNEEIRREQKSLAKDANLIDPFRYRQGLISVILNESSSLFSSSSDSAPPLLPEIINELQIFSKVFYLFGTTDDQINQLSRLPSFSENNQSFSSTSLFKLDRYSRCQKQQKKLETALLILKGHQSFHELEDGLLKIKNALFEKLLSAVSNFDFLTAFDRFLSILEGLDFSLVMAEKNKNPGEEDSIDTLELKKNESNIPVNLSGPVSFNKLANFINVCAKFEGDKNLIFLSSLQTLAKIVISPEFIISKIKLSSDNQNKLALLLQEIDISKLCFVQLEFLFTWIDQAPYSLERNPNGQKNDLILAPIKLLLNWQKVTLSPNANESTGSENEEPENKVENICDKVLTKINNWVILSSGEIPQKQAPPDCQCYMIYYLEALKKDADIQAPFNLDSLKYVALEIVLKTNECSLAELKEIGTKLGISEQNLAQSKMAANFKNISDEFRIPKLLKTCLEYRDPWFFGNLIDAKDVSGKINDSIVKNIDQILKRSKPADLTDFSSEPLKAHLVFSEQLKKLKEFVFEDQAQTLKKIDDAVKNSEDSIRKVVTSKTDEILQSFSTDLMALSDQKAIEARYKKVCQDISSVYSPIKEYSLVFLPEKIPASILDFLAEETLASMKIDEFAKSKENIVKVSLKEKANELLSLFKQDLMELADEKLINSAYEQRYLELNELFRHEIFAWNFSAEKDFFKNELFKYQQKSIFEIRLKACLTFEDRENCWKIFSKSNTALLNDKDYRQEIERLYQKYDDDNFIKFSSLDIAESAANSEQLELIAKIRQQLGQCVAINVESEPPNFPGYLQGLQAIRGILVADGAFDLLIFNNLINDLDKIIYKLSISKNFHGNLKSIKSLLKPFEGFFQNMKELEDEVKDEKNNNDSIQLGAQLNSLQDSLKTENPPLDKFSRYKDVDAELKQTHRIFWRERRKLTSKLGQIRTNCLQNFINLKSIFEANLTDFFRVLNTLYTKHKKQAVLISSDLPEFEKSYKFLLACIANLEVYKVDFPEITEISKALKEIADLISPDKLISQDITNTATNPISSVTVNSSYKSKVKTPKTITSKFVSLESLAKNGRTTCFQENITLPYSVAEMMGIFLEDYLQKSLETPSQIPKKGVNKTVVLSGNQHKLEECIQKYPQLSMGLFDTILLIKERCEQGSLSDAKIGQSSIPPYTDKKQGIGELKAHNQALLNSLKNTQALASYLDNLSSMLSRANPNDRVSIEVKCVYTKLSLGCYRNSNQALSDLRSKISSCEDILLRGNTSRNIDSYKAGVENLLKKNFPTKSEVLGKIKSDPAGLREVSSLLQEVFHQVAVVNDEVHRIDQTIKMLRRQIMGKGNHVTLEETIVIPKKIKDLRAKRETLLQIKKQLPELLELIKNLSVLELLISADVNKNKKVVVQTNDLEVKSSEDKERVISSLTELEAYCSSLLDRSELLLADSKLENNKTFALKPIENFLENLKIQKAPAELYLQTMQIYNAMRLNLGLQASVLVMTTKGYEKGILNDKVYTREEKLFDLDQHISSTYELEKTGISSEEDSEIEIIKEDEIKALVEEAQNNKNGKTPDLLKEESENEFKKITIEGINEVKDKPELPKQVKSSLTFFSTASAAQRILSNFHKLAMRSENLTELSMFFENQLQHLLNIAAIGDQYKPVIGLLTALLDRLNEMHLNGKSNRKDKTDLISYQQLIVTKATSILDSKINIKDLDTIKREVDRLFANEKYSELGLGRIIIKTEHNSVTNSPYKVTLKPIDDNNSKTTEPFSPAKKALDFSGINLGYSKQ